MLYPVLCCIIPGTSCNTRTRQQYTHLTYIAEVYYTYHTYSGCILRGRTEGQHRQVFCPQPHSSCGVCLCLLQVAIIQSSIIIIKLSSYQNKSLVWTPPVTFLCLVMPSEPDSVKETKFVIRLERTGGGDCLECTMPYEYRRRPYQSNQLLLLLFQGWS